MLWLFTGLLGGFAFVYLTRLYWADAQNTDQNSATRSTIQRGPIATAAIVVLVLALVMLATTGKVHWLSALVTGAIPFARRALSLLRFAPLLPKGLFDTLRKAAEKAAASDQTSQSGSRNQGGTSIDISMNQARLILDVSATASNEEIIAAHRRLIAKNHPDKGGSTYIAAQLNTAKDLLLNAQKS